MHTAHTIKTRQRGAVLVVSLLILLVLTLIGVSSLDGSIMEAKMASNSHIATTTFQKAESSIREAYYVELANPLQAVGNNRHADPRINRNHTVTINGASTTIISTSQHKYDPAALGMTMKNSSDSLFEARPFEIVGTARVGAIQSVNTQGYQALNAMRRP